MSLLGVLLGLTALCGAVNAQTSPSTKPVARSNVVYYELHVGLSMAAPDCFEKQIVTINGQFLPPILVTQGDFVQLNLFNDLPENNPVISDGISIHWHGLDLRGYEWYDGVGYLHICPIPNGENFTYAYQVNEAPGTYFYHAHSSAHMADGLQGPFIVYPTSPEPFAYNEERIMLVMDWWHAQAAPLAMPLAWPFDPDKLTNDTGLFQWVDNPQAVLINGMGFFMDCAMGEAKLFYTEDDNIKCDVKYMDVPPGRSAVMPWASNFNPGCRHWNTTVEKGKSYRFRIINGGALAPLMMCFEKHNITIVQADATYTQPIVLKECIEFNLAQRYDLILKADQPIDNYWISVYIIHFAGSPMGFGVMNYKGAPQGVLPTRPNKNPADAEPWGLEEFNSITTWDYMINYDKANPNPSVSTASLNTSVAGMPDLTSYPWPGTQKSLRAPLRVNRTIVLNITQPVLPKSGMLRYSINDVSTHEAPPCQPVMKMIYEDPTWVQYNTVKDESKAESIDGIETGNSTNTSVWITGQILPTSPKTGQQYIVISLGEIIDVILQNLNANANGGDYRNNSLGLTHVQQEQHPFHMHGHHFWVMAHGDGIYDPVADKGLFNLDNPMFRDTVTVVDQGWAVLRFIADNPGLWAFHCHIFWHAQMGQVTVLAEQIDQIGKPPPVFPTCNQECYYQFATWKLSTTRAIWGTSGYELPNTRFDVSDNKFDLH